MLIKILNSEVSLSPPADSLRESKRWGFIRPKLEADKAFTLSELMIATLIFALTFAGVITVFFRCIELSEMTRHSSTAVNACKNRIASIENTAFNQILAAYNNTTFTAADINGIGKTYVTSLAGDLLQVTLVFCWKEKNGRALGEDKNINGSLDAGEDTNGNGVIDSPVKVTTYIYDVS